MKVDDIKAVAERRPFRPFTLCLNDGAQYTFSEPRNFGAPEDYHVVFYFGKSEWVILDLESIAEIIQN